MCLIRRPLCGMIRFMFYLVVRIIRLRNWEHVLHASVFLPALTVSISLHSVSPFFTPQKMIFSNMIIPEAVKIHALFKQKRVYMYLLTLPGIIKYPVYQLRFQKIFSIGRKKGLRSTKHTIISFWTK